MERVKVSLLDLNRRQVYEREQLFLHFLDVSLSIYRYSRLDNPPVFTFHRLAASQLRLVGLLDQEQAGSVPSLPTVIGSRPELLHGLHLGPLEDGEVLAGLGD